MISGFIQAFFFAAMFLLFIDGEVGWLIIYALIGAILISITLHLISRRHYSISIKDFTGVHPVGGYLETELTFRKTGFCLIPRIELYGACGGSSIQVTAALLLRHEVTVPVKIPLTHCGLTTLTFTAAAHRDFLGLFGRRKPLAVPLSAVCAVLPRTVDYTGATVIPSVLPSEDEDTEEGRSVAVGGLPGYEHRPYISGDSPRRINYKLSAKKGSLMVRLDENSGTQATNILILPNATSAGAEQAMALSLQLIAMGGSVRVTAGGDSFCASTPETAGQLREWLSFRDYTGSAVAPADTAARSADIVISGDLATTP